MSHSLATFLTALEPHLERPMVFDLGDGKRVPVGYHVTEFKALEYHTVDCGGVEHRFQETVIELWRTALETGRSHMATDKFLKIYNQVSPKVAFQPEADLIFLYGAPGEPGARYAVGAIEPSGEELIVRLEPDGVRCKAADRKVDAALSNLTSCCGASAATSTTPATDSAASANLCC